MAVLGRIDRGELAVEDFRALVAFGIQLAGLLIVEAWLPTSSGCWPAWILVGAVAGAMAGRPALVWAAILAALAFYPVAGWLGLLPDLGPNRIALTAVGGVMSCAAFVVVAGIVSGGHRRAVAAAVAAGALAFGGFAAYGAVVGSDELVHPTGKWAHCATPATAFGWPYEAVNYDRTLDDGLDADGDTQHCSPPLAIAGSDVVAPDGTRVAGWYVPAADGSGPTGPTLVMVHGWKSNASETILSAEPFHPSWNLLLVELRNSGRSTGIETTWGLREQDDVRAMLDWLEREKGPAWIAAYGNSMGGATITLEAASDPRVRGLILDSTHGSVVASFSDTLVEEQDQPPLPTAWTIVVGASLRIGADLTAIDPVRTIGRLGDRPVLIVHSDADLVDRPEHSAERNLAAALEAGVPAELRYCPGARHGHLFDACPSQFAAWTTEFLDRALAADGE